MCSGRITFLRGSRFGVHEPTGMADCELRENLVLETSFGVGGGVTKAEPRWALSSRSDDWKRIAATESELLDDWCHGNRRAKLASECMAAGSSTLSGAGG